MNYQTLFQDSNLPANLNEELIRLSQQLSETNDQLTNQAYDFAIKENNYRRAKAHAYINIKTTNEKATIPLLEALVDKQCDEERREAYLARAIKEATLERVKSLRAQLSALQSVAASVRSELELAGKGPNF